MGTSRVERCDVIVVGAGTAAFAAAVSARQSGAERVVMLEKASEPESGGNARFSHTGFRFAHGGPAEIREYLPQVDAQVFERMEIHPYSTDQFLADLQRVCQGRVDPELADTLTKESGEAVRWMRETGIAWEPDVYLELAGRILFEPGIVLQVTGGGIGQLDQWRQVASKLLVDIRYGSKVSALLGGDHQIEGVTVSTPASTYELQANAVILCSGGFQASSEMRARYLGPGADLLKVRGSRHDTGEVLQMALAIGAGSAGHWQGAHATPVDATYPDIEIGNLANRYSYRHGITVNGAGHRFFDEGEAEHSFTYAKTGWAISREPGGIAYQIFDQQGHDHVRWQYRRHATAIQANTIAQLANLIGIDAHGLQRTVDEFNAAVPGDPTFDPARPDGRATTGIAPQKSHWSTRIETPPFRAYPVTGGITFTFGGLRISRHAEVLNTSGHPIRGLYASGDVVGLFYFNYPSCTGQTRNAVFSRLAGRNAVRHDIPTESTTLAAR